MSPKDEHVPVYYDPNWEDPTDVAKKKYFSTKKGKEALKRAQSKYYHGKKKPENELARAFQEWLEQNPGKTVEDFLNEQNSNIDG